MGNENITVKKRLIMHLLEMNRFQDDFECPTEVTQKGIAKAIKIHRSAAARELNNCIEDEIVFSKMSNIKAGKRRKKVYFLTTKGFDITNELKENFLNLEIKYREEINGEYKIGKISRCLNKFHDFSLVQVLNNIDKDEIDFFNKNIEEKTKEKIEKLSFSVEIPKISRFIGRKKELNEIKQILENEKSSITVVTGIAGIGKTTLVAKIASEVNRPVFWNEVGDWTSLHHLIRDIGEFLSKSGSDKLKKYIARNFDFKEILEILKNDLDNVNFILVFDDFHHANEDIEKFFFYFIKVVEKLKNVHVLITSRDLPKFYDRRDVHIKNNVYEFELIGFNKEDIAYILGKNKEKIDEIYNLTKGHPLALELLANLDKYEAFTDFQTFLEEEIFRSLSIEEKEILGIASLYRYPAISDGILAVKVGDYNTLLGLVNRNFIKRQGNNFYVHDLIKEFFSTHINPVKKKNFHLLAADYYNSQLLNNKGAFFQIFERLYHLINAEDYEESANLILDYDDEFIENADIEFLDLLNKLDINKVSKDLRQEIIEIKGDASAVLGEYEHALEHYKKNLDIIKEDSLKSAEVFSKIADVSSKKGEIEESISYHLKSLSIFKRKKRKNEMAKIYNDLGLDFTKKGEMTKALEYFTNALNCLDKENIEMKHLINLNIGNLFALSNDFKNAVKYYNKPLKEVTVKKEYYKLQISSFKALAEIERKRNNLTKIENYMRKALEIAKKNKDSKECLTLTNELIDFYVKNQKFSKAVKFITEIIDGIENLVKREKPLDRIMEFKHRKHITKLNELHLGFGELCEKASVVFEKLKDWNNANIYYEKSVEIFKNAFMDKRVGKIYLKIAINCSKTDNVSDAEKYYLKSIEKLNRVREFKGLAIVHLQLGNFYRNFGRINDAKREFECSRDFAKNMGFISAKIKVEELLNEL